MSGNRGRGREGPREQCHLLEPSLAAFVEGALSVGEAQTIAEHVAGCSWCTTRLAAFTEVDALLRKAPTPPPPPSLRAGLYARVTAEVQLAAQKQRTSAVESIVRKTDTPDTPAVLAPPVHPSRQVPASAAITRWIGVVAAVLIVALLAGIFAIRGQRGTDTGPAAQSTATDVPQRACAPDGIQASLPSRSRLADLAMTGPGMGWAVGAIGDSDSGSTTYHTLILRFRECQWTAQGPSLPNAGLASIAMVSQNEGWAAGAVSGPAPLLLHYAHGAWNTVTPPPTGNIFGFSVVRALPNGEVWVVGRTPAGTQLTSGVALLHLASGHWTRINTSLNEVTDIGPAGPDDAWLIGAKYPSITTGQAELAHVHSGVLRQEVTIDTHMVLTRLRMLAPNDGWAMGIRYASDSETNPNPITPPVALHYDGSRWTEVHTGVSATARAIDVLGQGSAWSYTTARIPADGPEYIISTQHEQAGRWQDVAWPFKDIQDFTRLTCVTADDCWAIGSYLLPDASQPGSSGGTITLKSFGLLLRYANGAWHEYGHL